MLGVADSHPCVQDLRLDIIFIDESFHSWHLGDPDLKKNKTTCCFASRTVHQLFLYLNSTLTDMLSLLKAKNNTNKQKNFEQMVNLNRWGLHYSTYVRLITVIKVSSTSRAEYE